MWTFVLLWLLSHLAGLLAAGHLLLSRKRTTSLILWTFWLLLFPAAGIPLYLLLGTDRIRGRSIPTGLRSKDGPLPEATLGSSDAAPLLRAVAGFKGNFLTTMAPPTLLPDTKSYYSHLLAAIESARDFVHVQTYVFRPDDAGDRFLEALCRAARRGVEVRLIVDEIGSAKTRSRYFDRLREAGGRFSWCQTVQPLRNRYFFNLRNHRKIQVVDGKTAYVGGMNFGIEYEGRDPNVGPWRDMQIAVEGPVVDALQTVFATDWAFATDEPLAPERYAGRPGKEASIPVAVVNSGPDTTERPFLKTFILACNHARERLDIFTPYFAPEDSVIVAMQLAARRGVRVRMLIPTPNEHQYMVDIGRAHYRELMEDGVEIYEYHEAVHHGKVYLVDNRLFVVGSTNLDARSLRLNFETTLLAEDRRTVERLDAHYGAFFEAAERIDPGFLERQPVGARLKQGIARLFGPLL